MKLKVRFAIKLMTNNIVVEEIELETWVRQHGAVKPPLAQRYVVRIDDRNYKVNDPVITGSQLLDEGITVPKRENCTLRLKRLQDNDFRTKINWLANTCIISNWKIAYPHSLGAE